MEESISETKKIFRTSSSIAYYIMMRVMAAKETVTLFIKLYMHVSEHSMSKHMRGKEALATVWQRNIKVIFCGLHYITTK
jgi:hypothetical protein